MTLKGRVGRVAVGGLAVTSLISAGLALLVMSDGTAGASLSLVIPDTAGAGYFTSGLSPTSASATFVIPAFTCTDVQQDIITVEVNWPNLVSSLDEVLINCAGAGVAPTYSTIVQGAGGTATEALSVAAGDKLKASISASATLVDATTKTQVTSVGGPEAGGGINAVFGLSRDDATTPTFGTLTFKAMSVDGTRFAAASSFTQDMTSASSIVQVHANPITHSGSGVLVFQQS